MRKFKLINSRGEEWSLNDANSFLQSPSGLGMSWDIGSIAAGYDWVETQNQLEQQTISGDIAFGGYQAYSDFARFVASSPLTLCYAPAGKWYYRRCVLESLGKTEINLGTRWLLCPVDFLCTSAWYDKLLAAKTARGPSSGKIYTYTYPYAYAETAAGSVEINNAALLKSPAKLSIFGPVTNPSWAMIQGGMTVSSGKVFATIPAGNKLVVDASPATMEIAERTTNNVLVGDLYSQSDFGTQRFLYIPPGECRITFSHEGATEIDAWVEVMQLAATV